MSGTCGQIKNESRPADNTDKQGTPETGSLEGLAQEPFIWTASANDILQKVRRARRSLDKVQSD
jgi:hypothetical protein